MFGALPQGIWDGLPRLLSLSVEALGAASGLAITKAGIRHVAKASNERWVLYGDIFSESVMVWNKVTVEGNLEFGVNVGGSSNAFVYVASW